MKLGIAYNIFDGEELLPYSLKCVRPFADFIAVVYQTTSNFGQENPNLERKLQILKTAGIIDKLFLYEPELIKTPENTINWKSGVINEIKKRDIGLKICKANDCDVFMTMDADELYDKTQFENALRIFREGDFDSSFCQMQSYYKLPTLEKTPPETYYVPLFYKIDKDSKMEMFEHYVVECDPTRRMKVGYSKSFVREEIQMYHYSWVRADIKSKVLNSSCQADIQTQLNCISTYENFKFGDKVGILGNQHWELKKVENKFNIKI